MKPARLVIGLLVGTTLLPSAAIRAQEITEVPEIRRINLNLKGTPFRKALEQVFLPGGLRVKLEADVPMLPVTLTLKEVDQDTAFRLVMRQAKKQVKDLQYEATDEGYRIFQGAPAEEKVTPYPLTPQPKLPQPLAPPTTDFPVIQNREVEPSAATLLQGESGSPVFPPPKESEDGSTSSTAEFFPSGDELAPGNSDLSGFGLGPNGSGGSGFGGTGYGSYGPGNYGYGSYGLGGNGFGNFSGYGGFGGGVRGVLGPQLPRGADPYNSPLAGGLSVSDQISQRLYEDKKPRRPYFYDHQPQWILERRTHFWGNGGRRARMGGGASRGGRRPSVGGNDGPTGGGYLPR